MFLEVWVSIKQKNDHKMIGFLVASNDIILYVQP